MNNEVNFEFDAYIAVDEENAMPFVVAKQSMLGQFLVRAIDGVNSHHYRQKVLVLLEMLWMVNCVS